MGQQGSKGPKITAQDRAILDLKLQRDKIKQYQKKLTLVSDREHQLAKEALARGDKEKARTALRRRKYQESLLAKTDGQLETLEGLVSTIEFTQIEQAVMHGLQQGNAVLKDLQKTMSLASVEKLMEETAEAQAVQREIDEMLATRMTEEEEEDVLRELAALESEQTGERAERIGREEQDKTRLDALPHAPSEEPVAEQPEESAPQRAPERERQAVLA